MLTRLRRSTLEVPSEQTHSTFKLPKGRKKSENKEKLDPKLLLPASKSHNEELILIKAPSDRF